MFDRMFNRMFDGICNGMVDGVLDGILDGIFDGTVATGSGVKEETAVALPLTTALPRLDCTAPQQPQCLAVLALLPRVQHERPSNYSNPSVGFFNKDLDCRQPGPV